MRHRNIIGPQVRRLRDKRGWSQERLAAKLQLAGLDISRSSLSKIESGEQAVFDFQVLYFRRVFKADSDISTCPLILEPRTFLKGWQDSLEPSSQHRNFAADNFSGI
jgi:transcriptional regulator with XRE-family HTH domain